MKIASKLVHDKQIILSKEYPRNIPKVINNEKEQKLNHLTDELKSVFDKIKYNNINISEAADEARIISYFQNKIRLALNEQSKHRNLFKFTDLFCGAGGLSAGLEQSGLVPELALDNDQASLKTYQFNRPYLHNDQILSDDIRNVIKNFDFKQTPLIVGGPPCQGFSNANKQRQSNDERNQLYKFYIHSVKYATPDIFLMENVEGLLKHIDQIEKDFNDINYSIHVYRLNTKEFGFPQNRKRIFIFGLNKKHHRISLDLRKIFTSTLDGEKGKVNFNLWDAIYDLPQLKAKTERNSTYLESADSGFTFGNFMMNSSNYANFINPIANLESPLLNHKSKYNNARDIKIYGLLHQGEGSDSNRIASINPYLNRKDIFKDKFFKLMPNEPCKTITAHMYYDCHMYIHPFLARGLTPREAARVQGFPDDYLFLGSPNEWYRQVGNAVSPVLGKVLGKALKNVLTRIYEF